MAARGRTLKSFLPVGQCWTINWVYMGVHWQLNNSLEELEPLVYNIAAKGPAMNLHCICICRAIVEENLCWPVATQT